MTSLLVTGASGFIGSAILRGLKSEDFSSVHAVSRNPLNSHGIQWHQADLLDEKQIDDIIGEIKPTYLLHCAWEVTPRLYSSSPMNLEWLRASVKLAKAFGEQNGKYFLGLGTSAEYDKSDTPCHEDKTLIKPNSIYGYSKASFWQALQASALQYEYKVGWARVFVPYGPCDPKERLIPMLMDKLAKEEPIKTTHGNQIRDFVHVDDIAKILLLMLNHQAEGAYNIGSNAPMAVKEIIEILAQGVGRPDLIEFGAVPLPVHEPMTLVADMTKVKKRFGNVPQTNIQQALIRLINEFSEYK